MSSLLFSSVVEDSIQHDGRRSVRYRYVVQDNLGGNHEILFDRGLVDSGFDVNSDISIFGATILESLSIYEEQSIQESSENQDVLIITLNPNWSTSKRIAKFLIRWMLRARDPRIVIWLEPLIIYLRNNFTAQQLANFLDVTTTQLQAINQKINRILEAPATVTSGKALIESYIADSQEIE